MFRMLWLLACAVIFPHAAIAQTYLGILTVEAVGTPNPNVIALGPGETLHATVSYAWANVPISGAEFRIVGIPEGWIAVATPNPAANVVIGSPLDGTGATILFPTCFDQAGEDGWIRVRLFDLIIIATSAVSPVYVYAARRNPPRNAAYNCALVLRCAEEAYAHTCVTSQYLCINNWGCFPSVETQTWSGVKSLYR